MMIIEKGFMNRITLIGSFSTKGCLLSAVQAYDKTTALLEFLRAARGILKPDWKLIAQHARARRRRRSRIKLAEHRSAHGAQYHTEGHSRQVCSRSEP